MYPSLSRSHAFASFRGLLIVCIYSDQGKMKKAEEMYVRALAGYEKACVTERISTLYFAGF